MKFLDLRFCGKQCVRRGLRPAKVLGLLLLCCLALACSRSPDNSSRERRATGDLSTPFQIHINNFVRRQPPAVYVAPQQTLGRRPSALFLPLRTLQEISRPVSFSSMLSRQIWQVWLSLNAFQTLEYAAEGFIPTPVGNTTTSGTWMCQSPVHPHACGEYAYNDKFYAVRLGSSPRLWGIPSVLSHYQVSVRFIPTPVGNTSFRDLSS